MVTPKSPLSWFGSKSRLAGRIVSLFPEHVTYVEPFAGGASVLLAKQPVSIEVFNDVDKRLVNYFTVVRDPKLFRKLETALSLTPCSRSEFAKAKESTDDPVEAARRFMVLTRQSYAGKAMEWSCSVPNGVKTRGNAVAHWKAGLAALQPCHERLLGVQVECVGWRECLSRYDSQQTLFYIDPPYIPATRVNGGYRHELTEADHLDLVRQLLKLRGMVILSGYRHEVHKPLEDAGWKRVDMSVRTFASDRLAKRTESLWLSPRAQGAQAESKGGRQADGARMTHKARVGATERRVRRVVQGMRDKGEAVTKAEVSRRLGIARETLSRRYGHLFR